MPDQIPPGLAGPPSLAIVQTSWWGPFSRRGACMALSPAAFSVTNISAAPCQPSATLEPLRREASGVDAGGGLIVTPSATQAPLAPNAALAMTLQGNIPARPGAYATTLRIAAPAASLEIPVKLSVPASPLWGCLCMASGLLLLGLVNLLAGEGRLNSRLRDALQARQDIHTVLEASPAPTARLGDVAAMDADFDAAIADLGARRGLSVVDHRWADAAAHLQAARTTADNLQKALAGRKLGEAEVINVADDWNALQATLAEIAAPLATTNAPPASATLQARLDAILAALGKRLVVDRAAVAASGVKLALSRMALDEEAGEGGRARDLAVTTRLWMRRTARGIDAAVASYRFFLVEAGWMLNTDRMLRDRAAHDDLSPDGRKHLSDLLDQATAGLDGAPGLDDFGKTSSRLNAAWTAQVRAAGETLQRRQSEANAAIARQTDYSDVTDLIAQAQALPKPHTLAMKQATLTQALALWRAHVSQVDDPDFRTRLNHDIGQTQAAVDGGNMAAIATPNAALFADWAAWQGHLVAAAADRLMHARCLEMYEDMQRNTGHIEAGLREQPPGAARQDWDRRLDAIRLDMQRDGPDASTISHDCAEPLLGIGARANALSGDMLTAALADVDLPAATRLRLAQESGSATAIAAIQNNLAHPRSLGIDIATPEDERVIGRDIVFHVAGADPVWGASVTVRFDFGDGTQPLSLDAEQLRQGARIVHGYRTVTTQTLSVRASSYGRPGDALGEGTASLLIAPNPSTIAQQLSDEFINLRFALSLLIASALYYWRYHSRTAIFGARGYDYAEAFALGFAADAALSNFPEMIAKLSQGG